MKVAILTSFPANPLAPSGGVEAVSVNLVAALARRPGLEVHVVTADRQCEMPTEIDWNGVTVHRWPIVGKLLRWIRSLGQLSMRDSIARIAPDVIHAHDFYGMMVTGISIPRVFTVHGFIHEDTRYSGGALAWLRARLWKRYEVAAWKDQPHIISISPYVRERLRPLVAGEIHDIENPIAAEIFDLPRDEREGTIFCAAAISPRKNTLGLVRAFAEVRKKFPTAQLRLAGPSPDASYRSSVQSLIQASGLETSVQMLGPIRANAVWEELSRASIFALLSFEEGAPMGVAEAMAAGVPVVTSNRCGMPFMVRHGETGFLIDPENLSDIAARFSELLSNAPRRRAMGAAARVAALDRFHPDRVAQRTEALYRRIAVGAERLVSA